MSIQTNKGKLLLITGPMFSGKTETLIAHLQAAILQGLIIDCFKPALDTRYNSHAVVTHSQLSMPAIAIQKPEFMLKSQAQLIGIDEAQFMDVEIIQVVKELLKQGRELIISGLEKDYLNRPFGFMPELIAMSTNINRLQAICFQCGKPADYTYRKVKNDATILLGETESYEARCLDCYIQ